MPIGGASSLGSAILTLATDDSKFSEGIKGAREKAEKLQKGLVQTGTALTALGAGFLAAAKHSIDLGDELAKTSQKVGVSVEDLSGLRHAAELSGVSFSTVTTSLARLARGASDASQGTGTAKDAFEALGISVLDSNGSLKGAQDLVIEISGALSGMEDGTQKTALAMDLFGKSGLDLIPLLNTGADGIKGMTDEAAALGLVMSGETAAASERFNDSLTRLTGAFEGLGFSLIDSGLLDAITELINTVATGVADFAKAHPEVTKVAGALGLMAAVVGPLLIALGFMLPALVSIVAVLTGPVGLVLAIGAALAALGTFLSTNETIQEIVAPVWEAISEGITLAVETITELFEEVTALWADIFEDWGIEFEGDYGDLWAGILEIVKAAFKNLAGAIKVGFGVLSGTLKVFVGAFTGNWEKMGDGLEDIWAVLWDAVKDYISAPIRSIERAVGNFIGAVEGFFDDAKTTLTGFSGTWPALWGALLSGITAPIRAIQDGISAFTGAAIGFFQDMAEIVTGAGGVWPGFWATIQSVITAPINAVQDGVRLFSEGLSALFSALSSALVGPGGVWPTIWALVQAAITAPITTIKAGVDAFLSTVSGLFSALETALVGSGGIWPRLWEGIKAAITAPITAVRDAVGGFTSSVSGFFSTLYDQVVGNSFVPDLMDGIAAEFGRLDSVMVAPARAATGAVGGSFGGMLEDVGGLLEDTSPGGWRGILQSGVDALGSIFRGGVGTVLNGDGGLAGIFSGAIGAIGGILSGSGKWGTILNEGVRILDVFLKGGVSGVLKDILGDDGIGGFGKFLKDLGLIFTDNGSLWGQIWRAAVDIFDLNFLAGLSGLLFNISAPFQSFLNAVIFSIIDAVTFLDSFLGSISLPIPNIGGGGFWPTALAPPGATGGLVPFPGGVGPLAVGGGAGGAAGGMTVNFAIQAFDAPSMERTVRREILPRLNDLWRNGR